MKLPKIDLPKWPCMTIVGSNVSKEQAKQIIFKTDSFLNSLGSFSGGNNKIWKNKFREQCGLGKFNNIKHDNNDLRIELLKEYWSIADKWCDEFGLSLQYLNNHWASSAYIDGASGWCSPDGEIGCTTNIGKWPTVKEVSRELKLLAKEFKFLDMTITLYDVGDEDSIEPKQLISFIVKNGKVSLNEKGVVFVSTRKELSEEEFIMHYQDMSCSHEQGLSSEMIEEFTKNVKAWIDLNFKELK